MENFRFILKLTNIHKNRITHFAKFLISDLLLNLNY